MYIILSYILIKIIDRYVIIEKLINRGWFERSVFHENSCLIIDFVYVINSDNVYWSMFG